MRPASQGSGAGIGHVLRVFALVSFSFVQLMCASNHNRARCCELRAPQICIHSNQCTLPLGSVQIIACPELFGLACKNKPWMMTHKCSPWCAPLLEDELQCHHTRFSCEPALDRKSGKVSDRAHARTTVDSRKFLFCLLVTRGKILKIARSHSG